MLTRVSPASWKTMVRREAPYCVSAVSTSAEPSSVAVHYYNRKTAVLASEVFLFSVSPLTNNYSYSLFLFLSFLIILLVVSHRHYFALLLVCRRKYNAYKRLQKLVRLKLTYFFKESAANVCLF
jgi:hypothetical protein